MYCDDFWEENRLRAVLALISIAKEAFAQAKVLLCVCVCVCVCLSLSLSHTHTHTHTHTHRARGAGFIAKTTVVLIALHATQTPNVREEPGNENSLFKARGRASIFLRTSDLPGKTERTVHSFVFFPGRTVQTTYLA